jgi:hypothetical protein
MLALARALLLEAHEILGFWINYGANQNVKPGHSQWLIAFAVQLIVGFHAFSQNFRSNLFVISLAVSSSLERSSSSSRPAGLHLVIVTLKP